MKILIQTNFTNIGIEKCENPFHPENHENHENPDSDKFHQHWHRKNVLIAPMLFFNNTNLNNLLIYICSLL